MTLYGMYVAFICVLSIRTIIVHIQRGWVLKYLDAVFVKFIEEERKIALRRFPEVPEEDHEEFWGEVEKRMWNGRNLWIMYDMYPSTLHMALSLDKWTYHQLFPLLYLNTSLGLEGKLEDIDKDLLE